MHNITEKKLVKGSPEPVNGYKKIKSVLSPAHQRTRTPACPPAAPGFTLLELVIALAIMGFLAMIMTGVYTGEDDQTRFEQTRTQMAEIKRALLGNRNDSINSKSRFGGYITDMGGLPALEDVSGTPGDTSDDQPKGLWNQGILPDWEYKPASRTWMGWRGPYLEMPPDGVLKDGWGGPIVFSIINGDIIMESYGADLCKDTGGETGFDTDLMLTIKQTGHQGAVAGRVTGFSAGQELNVRVRIYIPNAGAEQAETINTGVASDGYFRFEPRDPSEPDPEPAGSGRKYISISAGIRSIYAFDTTGPPADPKPFVFTVEPAGNWIGDISIQ